MGQNQNKEGEPGQDNSSAGTEEKGPSLDPWGVTEEGNPTIETCGAVADEEKAVGGSLDEGPGRESTSPTLEQGSESHDKVCAPTEGGLAEGGDGEKGGGKNSEESRAEPLDGIRRSDNCTQGTREARCSEPAHKREDMEKASVGERVDMESMLEDYLEHDRLGQHQENLRCDLVGKDEVEWPSEKENRSEKETHESVYGIENKRECQEGNRTLEAGATDILNINTSEIVDGASDVGLTNTGPAEVTSEILQKKDILKLLEVEGQMKAGVHNTGISPASDGTANIKLYLLAQDKVLVSTRTNENIVFKDNTDQSRRKRPFNKLSTSNPGFNLPTETSKDNFSEIQVKEGTEENPLETPDMDTSEIVNTEHSPKNKDVCGAQDNVARFKPADDVIKARSTRSSLEGADLQNQAVSLERAWNPEDFRPLEVASKSPLSSSEGHQQISSSELTQDEHQKERQFNLSDLESFGTKEPSLERLPTGGQQNKDGIRETEELKSLESASKGLLFSHAKKTDIKDLSLRGAQMEEGYRVTSRVASGSILDINKPLPQSYEDEECDTSSKDIMYSQPPFKSDKQVTPKNKMVVSPLSQKAKVYTEKSQECFLSVKRPQLEIFTLPKTVDDATHDSYPKPVNDATDQQRLDTKKISGSMMSSKSVKDGQSNQNIICSKTDILKKTSPPSSFSELIAGLKTASDHNKNRLDVTAPLSGVDKKTEIALTGSHQPEDKGFLKILTNEASQSTLTPTDVSNQVQDGCGAGTALSDSATNTSAAQDVRHSSLTCNLISMQANGKHSKVQSKHTVHALASQTEEEQSKNSLTKKRATEGSLSTDNTPQIMEITQGLQKSRHVSDMIKETIELQKKMKEWTKPTEARVDPTLDPSQSVKVAQMKAAFDPPKKSPDKKLERKASVRKGKMTRSSGTFNNGP